MKPYQSPEIQKKLAIIKDVILRVVPNTVAIYLFGSYAYGTPHKYSDLDIFVLIPDPSIDEFRLGMQIKNEIQMAIDTYMALDVIVNNSESFKRNLRYLSSIDSVIADTGIKIYG